MRMVWLYADHPTHRIARELYAALVPRLFVHLDFYASWWSLPAVRRNPWLELAARDAAQADMIFCSLNDAEDFPAQAKAWVDLWLPRKDRHDSALVALIRKEPDERVSSSTEAYLRDVAKSAGMDFFVRFADASREWPGHAAKESIAIRQPKSLRGSWPPCYPPRKFPRRGSPEFGSTVASAPVRFEFHHPAARQVFVAGSFNNWNPDATPLVSLGGGRWLRLLWLSPGKHEYLFVADGIWFFDPNATDYVPNVYGTMNAVVEVANGAAWTKGHRIRNAPPVLRRRLRRETVLAQNMAHAL